MILAVWSVGAIVPAGKRLRTGNRNQTKSRKSFDMQKAGTLDPRVIAMWEDAPNDPKGARKRQTEIIEATFEAVNGKWTYDPDKPFFKEKRERDHLGS